jgi:hypothetical protein
VWSSAKTTLYTYSQYVKGGQTENKRNKQTYRLITVPGCTTNFRNTEFVLK